MGNVAGDGMWVLGNLASWSRSNEKEMQIVRTRAESRTELFVFVVRLY